MNWTLTVAIVGAVTGCLSLAWRVVERVLDGPRMKVSLEPVLATPGGPTRGCIARVSNHGRHACTITSLWFETTDGRPKAPFLSGMNGATIP